MNRKTRDFRIKKMKECDFNPNYSKSQCSRRIYYIACVEVVLNRGAPTNIFGILALQI